MSEPTVEVDVTSTTGLEAYQALGVPELWRFEDGQLRISVLQNDGYQDSVVSAHFPQFDLIVMVEKAIVQSRTEGRSQTLRAFRNAVRDPLQPAQ